MKQRYNKLSRELCLLAVWDYLDGKWNRRDTLAYIEEWAGIDRALIYRDELEHTFAARWDAMQALAMHLEDCVLDILAGRTPEEMEPVLVHQRRDGMTGKIRDIADLCILHQLLGHLVKRGLEPYLRATLLPHQHASIPGHGQTALAKQVRSLLRRDSLKVQWYQKVDGVHAYASVQYARIIERIRRDMPSAGWILALLEFLAAWAPGGHLIIGGYLDAWLFNLAAAWAMRYALSCGRLRRGRLTPYLVRIVTHMDDLILLAANRTGLERGTRELTRWAEAEIGLRFRPTTSPIRILPAARERERRARDHPAARACPNIDAGGYRISRTHTTIRPRCSRRILRAFDRAWREIQTTGTLHRQRARRVIAYNGPVRQSDSRRLRELHHVDAVLAMARRVVAYWGRIAARTRKEKMQNAVHWYDRGLKTAESFAGAR